MTTKRTQTTLRTSACAALLSLATAAFGAGCGTEPTASEDISSAEEAIGSSCGSAAAHATFTGQIDPMHVSPRTYNACTKSYIVDVNTLSASYTGLGAGGGPDARISVSYQDTGITTQAACTGLWGGALLFHKVGGVSQTGNWLGGALAACETPLIEFTGLVAGESYRVAASMRQGGTAGPTRKVGIVNLKRVVLH